MSTTWVDKTNGPKSISNAFGAGTSGQVLTSNGGTAPVWSTPAAPGTGTVTSVAASVPSVFSITGTPITTSGTLAMTYSGTALPVANGGTAQTSLISTYTASTVAARDSAGLLYGQGSHIGRVINAGANYTFTASADGTGGLAAMPEYIRCYNGANTAFTINLPSHTTVQNGRSVTIACINGFTGLVTVNDIVGGFIATITVDSCLKFTLLDNTVGAYVDAWHVTAEPQVYNIGSSLGYVQSDTYVWSPSSNGNTLTLTNNSRKRILVNAGWTGGPYNDILLPDTATIAIGTTYTICLFNNIAYVGGQGLSIRTSNSTLLDSLGWLSLTVPYMFMNMYVCCEQSGYGSQKNRWCAMSNVNGTPAFVGGGHDP